MIKTENAETKLYLPLSWGQTVRPIAENIFGVVFFLFAADYIFSSVSISKEVILLSIAVTSLLTLFSEIKKQHSYALDTHTQAQITSATNEEVEDTVDQQINENYPFILSLNKDKPVTYVLPEFPTVRTQIVVPSELHKFVQDFLEHDDADEIEVKPLKAHNLNFAKSHHKKINRVPYQIIETSSSDNQNIFNIN